MNREVPALVQAPAQRAGRVGFGLAVVTLALFARVVGHDFIHYDDPLYVTANDVVRNGLSLDGLAWAFKHLVGNRTYRHPLTWVSHMLDVELFGMRPGAHHAVNAVLHTVNVLLLFCVLRRLTGSLWRSACAAALFAWHPLQVDTVAWIAERKNLLATAAALGTIVFYQRYTVASSVGKRAAWYVAVVACYACALMCKAPLVVTLPFLLLLLDCWPLARMRPAGVSAWKLVIEKVPLFALSVVGCAIVLLAHRELNLIASATQLPVAERVANALVAYARYLGNAVWPSGLAVHYPLQPASLWVQAGSAVLVGGVSVLAVTARRRLPFLFVGWFWFAGTLVPFIGLVQAGAQGMADRFMYLPIVGLCVAGSWGLAEVAGTMPRPVIRKALAPAMLLVLAVLAVLSFVQLGHWRNTLTLFAHTVHVTERNAIAHVNYGSALREAGDLEAAADQYQAAIAAADSVEARFLLARLRREQGRTAEAVAAFLETLRAEPRHVQARIDLGGLLTDLDRLDEACQVLLSGLAIAPRDPYLHYNLGVALERLQQHDDAATRYLQAIRIKPDYADAHNNLATLLAEQGRFAEAAPHLFQAVRSRPDDPEMRYNLSYVLDKLGRSGEAQQHRAAAVRLRPDLLKSLPNAGNASN